MSRIERIVNWLKGGYPQGIPEADYVPLLAVLARVPWGRLPALLTAPESVEALALSIRTCTLTTLLAGRAIDKIRVASWFS